MVINRNAPTGYFWNCLGTALFVGSMGVAISVARTESLSLEVARYKLQTGTAIDKVIEANDDALNAVDKSPLPPRQKRAIKQKLTESNKAIANVEAEISESVTHLEE